METYFWINLIAGDQLLRLGPYVETEDALRVIDSDNFCYLLDVFSNVPIQCTVSEEAFINKYWEMINLRLNINDIRESL